MHHRSASRSTRGNFFVSCQFAHSLQSPISSRMQQPNQTTEQSPDEVYLTAVIFESMLAVVALFLGWALGPDPREHIPALELGNGWPIASGILYGCLAAIPILLLIDGLRRLPWEPVRQLERLSDDSMIRTLLKLRPGELIVISLCAGIGEELLFRGWMLGWMAGAEPTHFEIGFALVASSLAFGLMHPITKFYVVLAALMGLYFGALLLWTENLLVPIAAHAAYDAVQLILTAREKKAEPAT